MSLQFCPVCKSLLQLKEQNNKIIGVCSCGFKRFQEININSSEHIKVNSKLKKGEGVTSNMFGTILSHVCSRCKNEEAEVTELGEITTKEESIMLFRCKKCGHVDREKI